MGVSVENLPPEAKALVKTVVEQMELAKDRHEATRRKAERYYKLYRSYKEVKAAYSSASRRDVDSVLRDAMHGFGTDLFIPYVFSVVETVLPRMLSQPPRMLVTPASVTDEAQIERVEGNVQNMKLLVERQQSKIGYPMTLQHVGKSGLVEGIGIQKVLWDKRYRDGRFLQPPTVREEGGPDYVIGGLYPKDHEQAGQPTRKCVYEGPSVEWVDLFDFIWDPRGWHLNSATGGCCRWVIHRTWLDESEIRERFETQQWELPAGVKLEDALSGGATNSRQELHKERMAAAGFPSESSDRDRLHEVWESHNGNTVTTILDASVPVQYGGNPHWHGELPFQVFRPTIVPGEMLGIGEAEAIEDLQEEMNIMRAQRRDNAAIVLQRPFAYFEGLVDVSDFEWGAGVGLGVDGDPSQLLHFFPVQDIPHSSYQEEGNLQRDIERVTGIDDTTSGGEGGGGASATATGVQLVQAAAGVRIQNKTRLLEQECVKPAAGQFVMLNQQKITSSSFIPGPPKPGDEHKSWSWYKMGPEELAGEFEIEPEGGSMAPPNPVEKMEKATRMWTAFAQDPLVDPMWLREYVLENYGVDNPRSKLIQPEQQITPEELAMAVQGLAVDLGIPPEAIMDLLGPRLEEAQALAAEEEAGGQPGQPQQPQGAVPPPEQQPPT